MHKLLQRLLKDYKFDRNWTSIAPRHYSIMDEIYYGGTLYRFYTVFKISIIYGAFERVLKCSGRFRPPAWP